MFLTFTHTNIDGNADVDATRNNKHIFYLYKHISYLYKHKHRRQKAPLAMLRSMQPESTNTYLTFTHTNIDVRRLHWQC